MKKHLLGCCLSLTTIILIASCTKKDSNIGGNRSMHSNINDKYFVTETSARQMAKEFNFLNFEKVSVLSTNIIDKMDVIPDNANHAAYYAIKYSGGGFLILSADFRQQAILGFSESGSFDFNNIPVQLKDIIKEEVSEINYLRVNNVDSIESDPRDSWTSFASTPATPSGPDNDCGGISSSSTHGPYIATTWDQAGGGSIPYNNLCPTLSCGKAPTGCVATAMAQIMNYYKWPSAYSWNDMNNTYSTAECARLMHDAGLAVDMAYGCGGSGAHNEDVVPALKNIFHYASSTALSNYNSGTLLNELAAYRPVYLSGGEANTGHAWVCDGYMQFQIGCIGRYMLHMNWGWGNRANGYFQDANWSPTVSNTTYTFNNNRKMIVVRK